MMSTSIQWDSILCEQNFLANCENGQDFEFMDYIDNNGYHCCTNIRTHKFYPLGDININYSDVGDNTTSEWINGHVINNYKSPHIYFIERDLNRVFE